MRHFRFLGVAAPVGAAVLAVCSWNYLAPRALAQSSTAAAASSAASHTVPAAFARSAKGVSAIVVANLSARSLAVAPSPSLSSNAAAQLVFNAATQPEKLFTFATSSAPAAIEPAPASASAIPAGVPTFSGANVHQASPISP